MTGNFLGALLLGSALLLSQHAAAVRPVLKEGQRDGLGMIATTCESLETQVDCANMPKCSWCVATPEDGRDVSSARGHCLPSHESKFLPPRLFSCSGKDAGSGKSVPAALFNDDSDCAKLAFNTDCDAAYRCTWCVSTAGWDNGSCYSKAHARFMPRQMFECDTDAVAATKQEHTASCALITDDDSCEGTRGCTWCASSWDTGICYDGTHAKHLPPHVYDCGPESKRVAKTQAHIQALKRGKAQALKRGDEPPSSCADFTHAHDCDDTRGCTWCTNPWGPAMCYDGSQARFLPNQYFRCGADHRLEDRDDDDKEEEEEEGEVHAAAVECGAIKDDTACDDEKACTWCTSDFLDKAACFSKTTAQYLPKVFVCDEDDEKKAETGTKAAAAAAAAGAAVDCEDNKHETRCDGDSTCTWCTSSFADKGSCFTRTAAKFLPPQMFDCGPDSMDKSVDTSVDKIECMTHKDQDGCDDHTECTWCVSSLLGKGACLAKSAAKILPQKMFTCDAVAAAEAREGEGSTKVDCLKVKAQADCDDLAECTWCLTTLLGKAACLTKAAAKILPPSMFTCDSVEAQAHEEAAAASAVGSKEVDCVKVKDQGDCDDYTECTWCLSTLLEAGACLPKGAAKILPPSMFTCDAAEDPEEEQEGAGSSSSSSSSSSKIPCVGEKTAGACDDIAECTWCVSTQLKKGACITKAAAQILPPSMFTCDAVEAEVKEEEEVEEEGPAAAVRSSDKVDCLSIKAQGACDDTDDCTWCASSFLDKGACFAAADAKALPTKLFECGHEEEKDDEEEEDDDDDDEDDDDDDEDEDDDVVEHSHSHSRNNVDCQPIKDEYSCDDERDCTWCTSSFLERGGCFPKAVAKYLPPHLFTCDGIPSRRHHHGNNNGMCDNMGEDECVAPGCVWCTSAAVGGGCFSPEEAAKLPSAIFSCKTAPS